MVINHGLIEFLHKHLVPGFSQDDVVLEVVLLIGQMCLDEDAARLLASPRCPLAMRLPARNAISNAKRRPPNTHTTVSIFVKRQAGSPLVKLVYDLLHEKQDDPEIVMQVLTAFARLLHHNDTSHELLYETQLASDACELLAHKNPRVQAQRLPPSHRPRAPPSLLPTVPLLNVVPCATGQNSTP